MAATDRPIKSRLLVIIYTSTVERQPVYEWELGVGVQAVRHPKQNNF